MTPYTGIGATRDSNPVFIKVLYEATHQFNIPHGNFLMSFIIQIFVIYSSIYERN